MQVLDDILTFALLRVKDFQVGANSDDFCDTIPSWNQNLSEATSDQLSFGRQSLLHIKLI